MDCLFCSIIAGNIPSNKIYEDNDVFAFLDIGPVSEGHTLIIPKIHAADLQSGTEDVASALMRAVYQLAPAIMKGVNADGYNLGMNHGECAGQEVGHTHLHLMPRQKGVERTFVKTHPTKEQLVATAEKIKSYLYLK